MPSRMPPANDEAILPPGTPCNRMSESFSLLAVSMGCDAALAKLGTSSVTNLVSPAAVFSGLVMSDAMPKASAPNPKPIVFGRSCCRSLIISDSSLSNLLGASNP